MRTVMYLRRNCVRGVNALCVSHMWKTQWIMRSANRLDRHIHIDFHLHAITMTKLPPRIYVGRRPHMQIHSIGTTLVHYSNLIISILCFAMPCVSSCTTHHHPYTGGANIYPLSCHEFECVCISIILACTCGWSQCAHTLWSSIIIRDENKCRCWHRWMR